VLKLLNDQQLTDPNQLASLVRQLGKDAEATLTVLRRGQEQKLKLKVGERLMPERRPLPASVEELRTTIEPLQEGGDERLKRFQERMRGFQERLRDYQKRLEEWRKNPTGVPPEPPKFEPLGAAGEPLPRLHDLLQEVRPGGAPEVRVKRDGDTTTWNTGSARVVVKDDQGEIEVRSENGRRTVTARDAAGTTMFTGPLDTEEQRQAVPEPVRKKLEQIHVSSVSGTTAPSPALRRNPRAGEVPPPPPVPERQ
jgi:hypothetical protein